MATAIANQSALAADVLRAIFNFGTHTYTAIQTAGPSQAVIGTATITVGGSAAQLNGGYASLATNGLVHSSGTIAQPITTSKSVASEVKTSKSVATVVTVTERRAIVTLASTTMIYLAPSGIVMLGTKIPEGSELEWTVGQQTLSPVYNGIVVASGSESETFTYQVTNVTRSVTATRTAARSSETKVAVRSSETGSFLRTASESTSSTTLDTTISKASATIESTSNAVVLIASETAAAPSMPVNASSSRGVQIAWLAVVSLLVGLMAA